MAKHPSKDELLDWIRENPQAAGKREIARAFGLKGSDRIELKRLLRELEDEGHIERRRKVMRPAGALPPVTVIEITGTDTDGELTARPSVWEHEAPAPVILVLPKKSDPAFGPGDRVLAKLRPVQEPTHAYEARPIKKIAASARRMIGIFRQGRNGGQIVPVDKKAMKEWSVAPDATGGARDGELVEAEGIAGPRFGLPRGRILTCHGDPSAPRQVSLIAMVQHAIPHGFDEDVLEEAATARPVVSMAGREDLRDLPLVTIDPPDARDHDDAVCAMPDPDPENEGGHIVWVAIADVAAYVQPGSALDREARRRGNSTYFPDRVSPMLPEALSADLCSLHEGVDRPCLAVRMILDAEGNKRRHNFVRAMMRSRASLTYIEAQKAADGDASADPELLADVIHPLYAAYRAAALARERRQPLALDLPERQIELDDSGRVSRISYRDRLDAHQLIEEFMVLANVCAAETLEAKRAPAIYRVHEEPNPEKLEALRDNIETLGLTLAKGQVLKTRHFNHLLEAARGTEHAEMVSLSVLRTQTQAYYAPQNFAHFGLNLARYLHFTSPIRRYADLIVHRSLISLLGLGSDGLRPQDRDGMQEIAEHISQTERRSMDAERDTVDRYLAAYLADREGAEFEGQIAGTSRAGLFVRLDETGADGLIPISTLGSDYFRHDRDRNTLTGERTGRVLGVGMRVCVRLVEAAPLSGGLILELLSVEGSGLPTRRTGPHGKGRRKAGAGRIKEAKAARRAKQRH